jgi:hypothetical protein
MAITFGITTISDSLIESVDIEHKADTKVLLDSDGSFSAARKIDTSYSFSVKGKGTTTVAVGDNGGAPTGVSGKIVITSVRVSLSNDDWAGFEYSGVAYPSAT